MTSPMPPYPEYKASGVPWLGDVPAKWRLLRGKWLFKAAKIINTERKFSNVLSLTLRGVVNNDIDHPEGLVPKDYATYQYFAAGDLVFKLIDLENLRTSRVGIVHQDGIMSPAYIRLTPVHNGAQRYFFHQYYDLYQRGIYNQLGAGVRSTLTAEDLLDVPVLLPPLDEQQAIVRYLDHIDRRVRRYIRAKQRLLALLHEQKQAIIHQAVTRGLDASAPLKPSGVAWLGEVPAHWEVVRIKWLLREVDERSTTGQETLLSMRMNHGLVPYDEHFSRPAQAATLVGYKIVRPGQIVMNRLQANNGLVFASTVTGLVSPDYAVFELTADVDLEFLAALFRSTRTKDKFRAESKGLGTGTSGFLRLYTDRFGMIPIALPPKSEQVQIMEKLSQELAGVNHAVAVINKQIDLIREYRTRLIADVVTGKVDVRAAAGALPAEVREEEAWAASEVEEDGEEGSEEELQRMQTENG